jgi:hypothetical protein
MRYTRVRWLVCLLSISFGPHLAHAGCAGPNLSSQIPDFQVLQTSRINALLRFGETYHLCFGVEYVDAALLTEVTDIQVRASTVG